MTPDAPAPDKGSAVERPLGAAHVASVVIGAMVGVGIFFTPAKTAAVVPSSVWLLALWGLGGVATMAGALVFADLGVRWPRAGGIYVFLRDGFGGRFGEALSFLYGWLQLLVVQPGAMGVIAVVLVDNLSYLLGPVSPVLRTAGACAAILFFTGANLVGLRTGGRIQIAMAAMKLVALGLLLVVGLVWGSTSQAFAPRTGAGLPSTGWSAWLLLGMIPVLFTFGGAYHGTFIGGSVRDPARSIPRGILAGVGLVLVGYLGVNLAYLAVLGQDGLAASPSPAADAVRVAFGDDAAKLVAAVIVVSAAGILNTIILGFPFVIHAMAKDGLFFAAAGTLNPRTGRPTLAVASQGVIACVAVVVGSAQIDLLLTAIAFADALFHAFIAVVHVRSRKENRYASVLVSCVYMVIELGMAIGCLIEQPLESAYGAAMLVVGVVAWLVWRLR